MDVHSTTAFLPLALGYLALRGSRNKGDDLELALALADKLATQIVDNPPPHVPLSTELELERIVSLGFAAEVQSTSPDTIEREDRRRVADGEPSQIIILSTRRKGMRLKHALRLD